ncbi:hypothetical protein Agabi119p4_2298 [Agaricus bisporus var. burnettii]|uniref:Uncharacterized protein n=1 Tax=Agaricus bisporus var. burnettii TaxID=192524 RepID=A0A8H7F903_AGABI|nr:hypothetical protein Agabi119p4_2298 [Agaricus bisporus var. burnettii]
MPRTKITKELVTVKAEENLSDTKMSSSFNGNTVDEDETQHSGLGDDDEEMSADEPTNILSDERFQAHLSQPENKPKNNDSYKEVVMENGEGQTRTRLNHQPTTHSQVSSLLCEYLNYLAEAELVKTCFPLDFF